jgi:mannose-6-phosphate isomerase-like protein (cupin superfamily)
MHNPVRFSLAAALVLVAGAALMSAQSPPTAVTVIPGAETRAAFEKGRPLIETSTYKVHASRREGPGQAEWHGLDTDIFYVVEGTATIVTGGQLTESKDTASNERRGAGIAGGTSRSVARGDVIIIPAGTVHQFTAVSSPFLYYTVKVTDTRSPKQP